MNLCSLKLAVTDCCFRAGHTSAHQDAQEPSHEQASMSVLYITAGSHVTGQETTLATRRLSCWLSEADSIANFWRR